MEDFLFVVGDLVLLFVNGMGGMLLIEFYVVYCCVVEVFVECGIMVICLLVGNYVISFEM